MSHDGTVLLTGATGFIGSHVLEALANAGLPVRAMVRKPSFSRPGVEVRIGDICDLDSFRKAARGCQVIIHTAGLPGIGDDAGNFTLTTSQVP